MNPKELKQGDKVRTIDGLDGVVHHVDLRTSPYIIYVAVPKVKAYLGWQLERAQRQNLGVCLGLASLRY